MLGLVEWEANCLALDISNSVHLKSKRGSFHFYTFDAKWVPQSEDEEMLWFWEDKARSSKIWLSRSNAYHKHYVVRLY